MSVRRCAVLGSPIAHSLSPVLHRAAYAELGLDWTYDAVDVTEDRLAGFLDGLDASWRGLSLTMPLKRSVLPLLDEVTGRAAQAGAVNTVVLDAGRRTGHNTDVPGIAAALRERHTGEVRNAVVLGGGATAASAVLGLADLGCREVTLMVREPERARAAGERAGRHPHPPHIEVRRLTSEGIPADVLVSTIPVSAQIDPVLSQVDRVDVVFDVVYDPWPTPLARRSMAAGRVLVSGLDLLVHQAALQVRLMTGAPEPPTAAMRSAGERSLAERAEALPEDT